MEDFFPSLPRRVLYLTRSIASLGAFVGEAEPNPRSLNAGDDEEASEELKEKLSLREAYSQLYAVVKLPAMRTFTYVLIACRLGMLPAEQVHHLSTT